jgi:hypothetical protein
MHPPPNNPSPHPQRHAANHIKQLKNIQENPHLSSAKRLTGGEGAVMIPSKKGW